MNELDTQTHRILQEARGWIGLKLNDEANSTLDCIPAALKRHPDVVAVRVTERNKTGQR
jgi:hypothetical protein